MNENLNNNEISLTFLSNLIEWLRKKEMSDDEIISCLLYCCKNDKKMSHERAMIDVTGEVILEFVAKEYNVCINDIQDIDTNPDIKVIEARRLVCYLCKQMLALPLNEIGRILGGSNPSDLIHELKKINEEMAANHELAEKIEKLQCRIKLQRKGIWPDIAEEKNRNDEE